MCLNLLFMPLSSLCVSFVISCLSEFGEPKEVMIELWNTNWRMGLVFFFFFF